MHIRQACLASSDIFARWLLSAPNHKHLTKAFINAVLEDAGHEQIETVKRCILCKVQSEKNFLTDARLREAQFEHEMFLHDQAQAKSDAHKEGYEEGMERGIATGMKQGIATGITRGEHEKAVAVAKNMKALGMAADVIEKVSGLTADEINKL